jgi:hypothetical protein
VILPLEVTARINATSRRLVVISSAKSSIAMSLSRCSCSDQRFDPSGNTACYQLRAKNTRLSRESTLSPSRITILKDLEMCLYCSRAGLFATKVRGKVCKPWRRTMAQHFLRSIVTVLAQSAQVGLSKSNTVLHCHRMGIRC